MKKILTMVVMLMISAATVMAQNAQQGRDGAKFDQDKVNKIFNAKVKMMKEQLLLSNEQTEQFIPIYKQYLSEMRKAFKNRKPRGERANVNTVDEARKYLIEDIDGKAQVLNVQKKFIPEFGKVLNAQQLMKFPQVENKIQHQIRKEFKRRGGDGHNRGPRNGRRQERNNR